MQYVIACEPDLSRCYDVSALSFQNHDDTQIALH